MPSNKRKLENFDPNKSDSNDTDFDPTEARPRKPANKSRSGKRTSGGGPKKRARYRGSDVTDDDVEDSVLEDSFAESEDEEDEDVEMNEKTGRAVRKAAKKLVNYEENSDTDPDGIEGVDSDEDDVPKNSSKKKRARATPDEIEDESNDEPRSTRKKSKIIKLKVATPAQFSRTTRAGSAAANRMRGDTSVEPLSAGIGIRRSTRAHTIEGDEPVELSTSGHHVIRASRSPEPIGRGRPTRGAKGVKQPASTIREEAHEPSSYEQGGEDVTVADEIAGTDDPEADEDIIEIVPAKIRDEADELAAHDEGQAQTAIGLNEEDEEDDDVPVIRTGRSRGSRAGLLAEEVEIAEVTTDIPEVAGGSRRLTRGSKSKQRKGGAEASSDFEPPDEGSEDELSASDAERKRSKADDRDDEYESSPIGRGRNARRAKSNSNSRRRSARASEELELDQDELAEELQDLKAGTRRRRPRDLDIIYEAPKGRRERKPVDYSIKPMDQIYAADEDGEDAAPTPSRRPRGGRAGASQPWERNLYTTFGPFGGGGGPAPLIGGPWGTGAAGGADSDSSDDETMQRPSNIGGNVGMTPTSAFPPGLLPGLGQTNNPEAVPGLSGTPANLGRVKSQKALADADPLGVDQNVDFSKVGGLQGHIDQLKEMVQMPLLYPELFMKFHVTPPRGVLFHGPPGTGKTLLARALAAQSGNSKRKITFYMRKGADALSKWVGEAERQLRLLFEEARKTQPSIIFFDEIDGLAPVRSSKQEQIHASIVSTLLALMDGMDGRGQVIVIGATNRPDNIDPALRRPGRFDREFYFPLPDMEARKSILNIHTKDWGLDDGFKDSLAHVTKGYGGADLRALCTEAALNAIQRTYPQIYSSNEKLKLDVDKIKPTAKDFMLSVKNMIPSSERATSSGASPLPKVVVSLLRDQLDQIEGILDDLIPIKKKTTALQEAMFEQYEDEDHGFARETLQQEFEKARVFRPRLLIGGETGMGQAYLGGALLNHFEGLHVQSFDLPTMFSDSTRNPEAAIIQLFAEVKRHKPSVIYLPGIDIWYETVGESVIRVFRGMLNSIPPTDPVLVLGITDSPTSKANPDMVRDLFGFSRNNYFDIKRPSRVSECVIFSSAKADLNKKNRHEFFSNIISYVKMAPKDFPEPLNRKRRKLEILEIAPPPPPKPPTKEEIKAQEKRDHQILNHLKIQIQPIMDQIHRKYKKFRTAVIPQSQIQYLFDEQDPDFVRADIAGQFRPFEVDTDKDGVKGLRDTHSQKFFYNLETTTIEERLSNGFYARPKDFLVDVRSLAKDAKHIGDKERTLKANELLSNVEVDIATIEANPLFADCEHIYLRQLQRAKEREEKIRKRAGLVEGFNPVVGSDVVSGALVAGSTASGPVLLGEAVPDRRLPALINPAYTPSGLSNGISSASQHPTSNGNSVPSRHSGDDVEMGGTNDHTQRTSQNSQAILPNQQWPQMPGGPADSSNFAFLDGNTQISQRSGFQEIPHGTSPSQLINDASTTTSGKKTSEGWSTQATNGLSHPDFSPVDKPKQDSELPDTQRNSDSQQGGTQGESSSDDQWPHSQAHGIARGNLFQTFPSQTPSSGSQPSQTPAVPPFTATSRLPMSRSKPASMANILNDSPVELTSSQASSHKDLIMDEAWIDELLNRLIDGSSGCSVEQLEQINRELMECLWKNRGQYNRTKVAAELTNVFNDTIRDIEEMQKVLKASQDSQFS